MLLETDQLRPVLAQEIPTNSPPSKHLLLPCCYDPSEPLMPLKPLGHLSPQNLTCLPSVELAQAWAGLS